MSVLSVGSSPVVRISLAEMVYNHILDAMLSGSLPSGAALNIADLAKDLNVSPSPVREALLRLATEGLATNNTNRRATVVSFSDREMTEIFEVRELLECGAARLAAPRIDAQGLAELHQAIELCSAKSADPAQKKVTLDLDNRFHLLLAEASGNRVLKEEIVRCSRRVRVMQCLRLSHARLGQAYPEHLAIVRALEKRDANAAEAAMRVHIRSALQFVREGLGPQGERGA
jgi:DNA-binding GntR family transcriptional regulator